MNKSLRFLSVVLLATAGLQAEEAVASVKAIEARPVETKSVEEFKAAAEKYAKDNNYAVVNITDEAITKFLESKESYSERTIEAFIKQLAAVAHEAKSKSVKEATEKEEV